jgi:hypothetical protein
MPVIISDGVFTKPVRLTPKDFLAMSDDEQLLFCTNLAEQYLNTRQKKAKPKAISRDLAKTPEKESLDDDGY